MTLTLGETADSLHSALTEYIEAAYHISDQGLVDQRKRLLETPGVIRQLPFIESTQRYRGGARFEALGLPSAAEEVLLLASALIHDGSPVVHNPPYQHQAESLVAILSDHRSIVVTTGTGSGKTECFLLPILGHLANQASTAQPSRGAAAVRALLLYPMNALVNDQLGRLRLLLGHPAISDWFVSRWGRPARFARYTSRTLYPGLRSSKRDQVRLRPLRDYYVEIELAAAASAGGKSDRLLHELRNRGKWPSKPRLPEWFGRDGSRWQDASGQFLRCVTLPDDPELLTRHEVLASPPDVLVTNYSMLEYMLMRPLERDVFEATRAWFSQNRTERFIVVVDEAHLYRGAAGAEVGLLLRRLRDRLGIGSDQLQVIATTASFEDRTRAPAFGAALTGKQSRDFTSIAGELALLESVGPASDDDARSLARIDLEAVYGTDSNAQAAAVSEFLAVRNTAPGEIQTTLFAALHDYAPMKMLVNETMGAARPLAELSSALFPDSDDEVAERAATALVALGSLARKPGTLDGPGLLPSRLHLFFRGLPGLWICLDSQCSELESNLRGGIGGVMYGQPRARCPCGSRIFELYTCRHCGSAYFRAYADDPEAPSFLWSQEGKAFQSASGEVRALAAVDVLMSEPASTENLRPADLDIVTGRLNPQVLGRRVREVHLSIRRDDDGTPTGVFTPCAVCRKVGGFGKSSVQDHQTKGDQPFQALVTRQVAVQPITAEPSAFAPMGGRKVLVFSDSRQSAARLAPNLQRYTTQDAVRPLLMAGMAELRGTEIGGRISLEDSYLAVLLAMSRFGVRLRPATRAGENLESDTEAVAGYLEDERSGNQDTLGLVMDFRTRTHSAPEALTRAIFDVTHDQYTGVAALALASVEPLQWGFLPQLTGLEGMETDAAKRSLVIAWVDAWRGAWLQAMPTVWAEDELKPKSGKFPSRMEILLPERRQQRRFEAEWLPILLTRLAEPASREHRLRGAALTLCDGGIWGYCQSCRSTQRLLAGREITCAYCGRNAVSAIDPDQDPVFVARKGYYRASTVLALTEGRAPVALVAAEHTAQLNEAQANAVFSEAEENELLFQDIDLGNNAPAIDVLSCTTTMEVGIDIGALSGVALRNMPPARANYQQRSGRAGRRGKAIATVTAYANSQSHDEHGFSAPGEFIRGPVVDPEMTLDNWQIARRHLTAFVLQEYLLARIPPGAGQTQAQGAQLFEVLGSVSDFCKPTSILNRFDFATWVASNAQPLARRAMTWLPTELAIAADPEGLVEAVRQTSDVVVESLGNEPTPMDGEGADEEWADVIAEVDDPIPAANPSEALLGRLLDRGVLPRYAFPTDIATFHVFDTSERSDFRPVFRYTPSQGMAAALSQYAPGKRVWIGGREWRSGALYSRVRQDRFDAWDARRLYFECRMCHYAAIEEFDASVRGSSRDCPACGSLNELGPGQLWLRPPGFAHPYYLPEGTSPQDDLPVSYATRAKLTTAGPADPELWQQISQGISINFDKRRLLVTNRGTKDEGYAYCTKCGLIEPAATPNSVIVPGHRKPFPDEREPLCAGDGKAKGVVLGTDFPSDVLLIGMVVQAPITLSATLESTEVGLRTLAEALAIQATTMLGIAHTELQAEFRPALSPMGRAGLAAEIYLYDTLSGGAGFAQRAGEFGRKLFDGALLLLENCPAGCDASCYRCLQNFRNQFEHSMLDRHLGASLLRYLLNGELPAFDLGRIDGSTDVLLEDLKGLGLTDLALSRSAEVEVPGFGRLRAPILAEREGRGPAVVGLHFPCAPGVMLDEQWTEPAESAVRPLVVPIDELTVRRNLPWASTQVLRALGYMA